jgi:predicted nuclease with TOPRIM domain
MFQAIKMIVILVIILLLGGVAWYVTNMRANLMMSEENTKRLKEGIEEQKALLEQQQKDIETIKEKNKELEDQKTKLQQDKTALTTKFNKRDFGKFASENPRVVEDLVNKGTKNAMRCFELASGATLNEKEKSASNPMEGNRECPSLINPAYNPPN